MSLKDDTLTFESDDLSSIRVPPLKSIPKLRPLKISNNNDKTTNEIEYALSKNILLINAESKSEILEIERISKRRKKIVNIGIRLNPNTDAQTLSQISTGKKENKFGVNQKIFLQLVNYLRKSKYLNLKCLSVHIGSQIINHKPYQICLRSLIES